MSALLKTNRVATIPANDTRRPRMTVHAIGCAIHYEALQVTSTRSVTLCDRTVTGPLTLTRRVGFATCSNCEERADELRRAESRG